MEEEGSKRVILRIGVKWQAEDGCGEAGTFLTGGFFGAEFLVEEVADFFDEDGGEECLRTVGGNINLAGVAAVATPKPRHIGSGKRADGWEEGKVGSAEGVEVFEGGRPIQARTKDRFQIGFGGRVGCPE